MPKPVTPREAREIIERENRERTCQLDLSGKNLQAVPTEIGAMTWLKKLNLDSNRIQRIEGIENLVHLVGLNLGDNQIEVIEGLENLVQLSWLYLHDNKIERMEGLDKLFHLSDLNLYDNKIQQVEGVDDLEQLNTLDLRRNPIQSLKSAMSLLEKNPGISLDISDCPLKTPPYEIATKGNEAIINFFDSFDTERAVAGNQVKLIFLGNSSTGKTSLSKFLCTGEFDPKQASTHGILNQTWHIGAGEGNQNTRIQVNIWDFGGQQYFHATHRLFLSFDAVYVIVCVKQLELNGKFLTKIHENRDGILVDNAVKLEHYKYPFWLKTIDYYTKDSGKKYGDGTKSGKKTNVFMVQNKCHDEEGESQIKFKEDHFDQLEIAEFARLDIMKTFAYTQGNRDISSKKYYYSFESWKAGLEDVLRKMADGTEIPGNYPIICEVLAFTASNTDERSVPDNIRQMLRIAKIDAPDQLPHIFPFINYSTYVEIVNRYTKGKPDFDNLHRYLQDYCGRILFFPHIPSVKDLVFIDPNWLHSSIYEILSPAVHQASGIFNLQHVENIVDKKVIEAQKMIDIMKEFHLVFEIGKRKYIAPQYLPDECPVDKISFLNSTLEKGKFVPQFSIRFPSFMPAAIISQYIAIKGEHVLNEICWRTGLLYQEKNFGDPFTHVYICCNEYKTQEFEIQLWLADKAGGILYELIIKDFVKIVVETLGQGHEDIELHMPGYEPAKWSLLCEAKKGSYTKVVDENRLPVSAQDYFPFLKDYGDDEINVFISYSHKHEKQYEYFRPLLRKNIEMADFNIRVTDDLDIQAGEFWKKFLVQKIEKCDIFIGLLSDEFFTSDYIPENELAPVLKRHKKNASVKIFLFKFSKLSPENFKTVSHLQIYKPDSKRYNKPKADKFFCYTDLNSKAMRQLYITDMANKLMPIIREIRAKKTLNQQ